MADPRYSRYYMYIKPALTNPYVRTYSTLVFSVIAITIFSLFAIRPTIKTIFTLQADIEAQTKTLETVKQKSLTLSDAKKNLINLDPKALGQLDELLPSKVSIVELMDELAILALASNVEVTGVQFQPIEIVNSSEIVAQPQVKTIQFVYNTQGSYQDLVNLLNLLSTYSRLISIDSVSFNKNAASQIVMSVNGKAFFLQ